MQITNEHLKETYQDSIGNAVSSSYLPVKNIFDFLFSLLIFLITLPVVITAIIVVKITSKGPAFYKQVRVGLMGKHIVVTKLRSMYTDAEANGAQWAKKNDDRITGVGRFLRKTRIDELPQLWNVMKGEMSLIGPRPERPEFTEQFSHEFPGFEKRLRVKPGLSGYAQVHGGYEVNPGEKAKLDCYYIDHIGMKIDFFIFIDTIKTVVTGEGAR